MERRSQMEQKISKEKAMDLTLEEMEKGIESIKGFVEDMENTKIGIIIKDHPDFGQIYNILNNLRILVQEYKRDLYEEYGHTHD
jgi:hypothetical protein